MKKFVPLLFVLILSMSACANSNVIDENTKINDIPSIIENGNTAMPSSSPTEQIEQEVIDTVLEVSKLVEEWNSDRAIFLSKYENKIATVTGTFAYSNSQFIYLYPVADYTNYEEDAKLANGEGRDSKKYVTIYFEDHQEDVMEKISNLKDGETVSISGTISDINSTEVYFLIMDAKFVE